MKFCPQCGAQNKDEAKFCVDCGGELTSISSAQTRANATAPQTKGQKNKWIPAVLNMIGGMIFYGLCGMGHAIYLKLYNRAGIFGAIGLLLSAISLTIMIFWDTYTLTVLTTAIGIGISIYAAYDAYKCSEAINEGRELPTIWGGLRPESISRGKVTGIAVVAVVLFVIALVAFLASYSPIAESSSSDIGSNILNDNAISNIDDKSSSSSDEGLQVKITYPGEWSASIGDSEDSTSYTGSGDEVIEIGESRYDVMAAAVQKTQSDSDKLKVEIIKDGKVLDSDSTTKEYGVVTVSATL